MILKVDVDTTQILNLREKEILNELFQGFTYEQIANKHDVMPEKIVYIVGGIRSKLGIQG